VIDDGGKQLKKSFVSSLSSAEEIFLARKREALVAVAMHYAGKQFGCA